MARAGFNSTSPGLPPVVDTLWMIWPTWQPSDGLAEEFSRVWLHELARGSLYEKTSFPWVISRVPGFKARLTDAVYIYSPSQRCGWTERGSERRQGLRHVLRRKRHH